MLKKLIFMTALSVVLMFSTNAFAAKKMKFIVKSADAQTQMMAMVLSIKSMKKGAAVEMVLCGPGGDLAVKGSKETVFLPVKKSPQMLLKAMIKKGVKVEICPLYLPAKGMKKDSLIKGVTIAKPDMVAEEMVKETTDVVAF